MINFQKEHNFTWRLKEADPDKCPTLVYALLVEGEEILSVFKAVGDKIVFTNKRIIVFDAHTMISKQGSYATLPYSKIQYFTITTPLPSQIVPRAALEIVFANGFVATFEFSTSVNIGNIGQTISDYML